MIIINMPMVQWELNRSNYDYLNMANEVIQTNKRDDLNITHDYNRPNVLIYKVIRAVMACIRGIVPI